MTSKLLSSFSVLWRVSGAVRWKTRDERDKRKKEREDVGFLIPLAEYNGI
jgi:hypothetical protein